MSDPVKRSGPPERRTPLRSGGPLSRSGGLRRTPIRSKPKRNPMPEGRWDEVVARDGGRCQAFRFGVEGRCSLTIEVHHMRNRGMGGSLDPAIHDADLLVTLCGEHHRWVTEHPPEARAVGLTI